MSIFDADGTACGSAQICNMNQILILAPFPGRHPAVSGLFALALFAFGFAGAQPRTVASQAHGWYSYFGHHRLSDRFGVLTETQFRRHDYILNWQQSLSRLALECYISPKFVATAGYGLIFTWPYGSQPVTAMFIENRIWQQLVFNEQHPRLLVQHRYRLEQRWLQNASLDSLGSRIVNGNSFRNRFRYRFMVKFPLKMDNGKPGKLFVSIYDEIFIHLNNQTSVNVFDQNRAYAAAGFDFNPNFSVQTGYMNQTIQKSDGWRFESNHTIMVSVFYHFDFRKKTPAAISMS